MKICKYCRKEVDPKAIKCPYCRSDMRSLIGRHPISVVLIIFFVLPFIFIMTILMSSPMSSSVSPSIKNIPEKTLEQTKEEEEAWQKSSAKKICDINKNWTREDCKLLADKKIWIGMSLDMLIYLQGKPNSTNVSNYGTGNRYQYCWYDYEPSCFYDDNSDNLIDSYN